MCQVTSVCSPIPGLRARPRKQHPGRIVRCAGPTNRHRVKALEAEMVSGETRHMLTVHNLVLARLGRHLATSIDHVPLLVRMATVRAFRSIRFAPRSNGGINVMAFPSSPRIGVTSKGSRSYFP